MSVSAVVAGAGVAIDLISRAKALKDDRYDKRGFTKTQSHAAGDAINQAESVLELRVAAARGVEAPDSAAMVLLDNPHLPALTRTALASNLATNAALNAARGIREIS